MKSALVIGYGNELRSDDAVAHAVLDRLQLEGKLEAVVELKCHQLTPELAELVSRSRMVVFVDASCGDRAGRVDVSAVAPVELGIDSLSHNMDPELLLALSHWLYGHIPPAFLVTVTVENLSHGDGLSPAVQAAVPAAVRTIREILTQPESSGLRRADSV